MHKFTTRNPDDELRTLGTFILWPISSYASYKVYSITLTIYITAKTNWLFYHRVVTLVAAKETVCMYYVLYILLFT